MKKTFLQTLSLALFVLAGLHLNAQDKVAASTAWKITGNTGTDVNINFLGTADGKGVAFRTNNVEHMRILKTGEVGIGTIKPAAQLNVIGTAYASLSTPGYFMLGDVKNSNMALDYNVIQARYNGAASSVYLNYYGGTAYVGPSGILQAYTTGVYAGGTFYSSGIAGVNGGTNSSYALNVNATSSLYGIQVTDPVDGYILYSAKSGLNSGIYVTKSSTSSGTPTIEGYNTGTGGGIEGYATTSGVGVYGYNGGANAGVSGYSGGGSGSVGVTGSCTGVGYGMSAYGDAGSGIYATSVSNYAGYFVGNVYSTGSYQGSDLKLKKNIKDVTNAMDLINQLHPKLYNFRNDGDYKLMHLPEGIHYGLIAQEVEKVLPNIVKDTKFETGMATPPSIRKPGDGESQASSKAVKSETIDYKALNYTELIPIMIKGMQEQQSVIEKQQQQIDELQQLVTKLANSSTSSSAKASSLNTGAYLQQNTPNPFSQNTIIKCNLPAGTNQASLVVYTNDGKQLKSYTLSNSGLNQVSISAGTLSAGKYSYALLVDGKIIDSKSMVITK